MIANNAWFTVIVMAVILMAGMAGVGLLYEAVRPVSIALMGG
jgi:hypothetical protein